MARYEHILALQEQGVKSGEIAGAAASIVPAVYDNDVLGHDHLMAVPGSGGDFNIVWEPILVLAQGCHGCEHSSRPRWRIPLGFSLWA